MWVKYNRIIYTYTCVYMYVFKIYQTYYIYTINCIYIDAWNNLDSTEDWDNEEYTGSLADTKVFTPSTSILEPPPVLEEQKPQEVSTQSGQGVNLSLLQQEVKFYQQILLDIFSIFK